METEAAYLARTRPLSALATPAGSPLGWCSWNTAATVAVRAGSPEADALARAGLPLLAAFGTGTGDSVETQEWMLFARTRP